MSRCARGTPLHQKNKAELTQLKVRYAQTKDPAERRRLRMLIEKKEKDLERQKRELEDCFKQQDELVPPAATGNGVSSIQGRSDSTKNSKRWSMSPGSGGQRPWSARTRAPGVQARADEG